jgi:pimeloyl-ACP methyl ester carboxylesterase
MHAHALSPAPISAGNVVLVDVLPNLDPDQARAYLRGIESAVQLEWHWPFVENILGRLPELQHSAANLRVPVHAIGGSRGNFDARALERFLQLVPNASVRVIDGASHLVARDRPHELAAALLECLALPA